MKSNSNKLINKNSPCISFPYEFELFICNSLKSDKEQIKQYFDYVSI